HALDGLDLEAFGEVLLVVADHAVVHRADRDLDVLREPLLGLRDLLGADLEVRQVGLVEFLRQRADRAVRILPEIREDLVDDGADVAGERAASVGVLRANFRGEPRDRGHGTILSIGSTRMPLAPAFLSCGTSELISSSSTTAWTATIPFSARFMTVGLLSPGISVTTAVSCFSGMLAIR